ncbi:MAG: hypothetical protein K8Q92_04950 [Methylophilales bacterium]|nr:hypothetical protein [Methylophilales bacterium]
MLGFILSTIAFFVAAYVFNRYLDGLGVDKTFPRKFIVGLAAFMISIGVGWITDKLDGDATLPQNNISLTDVLQGKTDPLQMLKLM